jgi:hypothetical protein
MIISSLEALLEKLIFIKTISHIFLCRSAAPTAVSEPAGLVTASTILRPPPPTASLYRLRHSGALHSFSAGGK